MFKMIDGQLVEMSEAEIAEREANENIKTVPLAVTRRQFKLGLLSLGLLDEVDQMIASSGDRPLQIDWAEALQFERQHRNIQSIASALNKSESDVDDLFILCDKL